GLKRAVKNQIFTFLGRLSVTRVIPGMCFSPNFAIALRAFFSLRECTVTVEPAGMAVSPAASASDSELSDASSTSAPSLGGSSGSSSMRGLDIMDLFSRQLEFQSQLRKGLG